jgi:hypothetical protein
MLRDRETSAPDYGIAQGAVSRDASRYARFGARGPCAGRPRNFRLIGRLGWEHNVV